MYVRHRTEPIAAEGHTPTCEALHEAIVQNPGVRAHKGSVDHIDGFLDQMKKGRR
jgi:hypothetical protein